MAKQNKYKELADETMLNIGGKDNISIFTHCVTRLRFNLKDKGLVEIEKLEKVPGIIACQWSGEQFQVIIGQGVDDTYAAICQEYGFDSTEAINENLDVNLSTEKKKLTPKNVLNTFLDTMTSILSPIIPALCGCGLLQGLLFSLSILGVITGKTEVYNFFYTIANTTFYFLPVIIGFSAGTRFKCNPYIAAVLGAVLIHPTFMGLAGTSIKLLGFIPIKYADYSSTIVPVILCVYFMSWVEKGLNKIVPKMVNLIVVPFFELAISSIFGWAILAPLGNWIGMGVVNTFMWLYNTTGPIGGALFAGCYPFILATGMQVAEVPVIMQNLATLGYDLLYPCEAAANAAMAAAAIYVFFKSKTERSKSLGASTGVTALIGVTEPVLFGIVLKYRKVLVAVCAGGAVGGFIMGLFKVQYLSFGFVPFGTIILAMTKTFPYYLLGVFAAMIVTVVILHFVKWEEK